MASFLWASPGGAQIDNLDDDCAPLSLDLETLAAGRGPAPAGAARPPVAFVKRRVILPPPFRKLPGIQLAGIFSSLIDLLEKVRGRGSEEEAEQEKCERVMRGQRQCQRRTWFVPEYAVPSPRRVPAWQNPIRRAISSAIRTKIMAVCRFGVRLLLECRMVEKTRACWVKIRGRIQEGMKVEMK